MTDFHIDDDLEIGSVFEVAGSEVKIALSKSISELTRSYSGRVYDIGQIGSILKLHLGRRLIFATVRLLRLQTDEEIAALSAVGTAAPTNQERRVIEADLLGEAIYNAADNKLVFKRGVSTYPLPLQPVHLLTKSEGERLFKSVERNRDDDINRYIPIGNYIGATKTECRANIDKLFGQHSAVLGSTGSGKSSAVAAIIHSVLERLGSEDSPAYPTIILIDPHGEYSAAFGELAEVFRAYDSLAQDGQIESSNLQLPYWLFSSDELRSLIIGKTEFEATSQANVVYKALTSARLVQAGIAKSALGEYKKPSSDDKHLEDPVPVDGKTEDDIAAFDRDKPRPFSLQEFEEHIRKRQAMRPGSNPDSDWKPVTASDFEKNYSSIFRKLRVLKSDPRINFMMSEYEEDGMDLAGILSQILNTGDGDAPLKIVDISGLPNEVAGPLTGAIGRLLFQYKLHQTRDEREKNPVLLVCEEAHRYVPERGDAQYEVAQSAIRRIAREGRKYGLGLMLVSQRPADIEGTVISQCNSWVVLRLGNVADQQHVTKFLPDSLSGMTKMLSSLPRQEALFVGEAAAIPARIKLRTLPAEKLPDSGDISFSQGWSSGATTQDDLATVTDRMTSF